MLPSPSRLQLGDCTIDLLSGQVQRGTVLQRLSAKELACISYLAKRPGLAVSRDELLDKVWKYDAKVISRTVDATVRRLRKKIEAKPSSPVHLVTVHGAGYRLENLEVDETRFEPWPMPRLRGRVAMVEALRREEVPLLTLTGPPGIGKSELALALAHHHVGTVLWVDLSQAQPDLSDLPAMLGLRDDLTAAFSVLPCPLVVLDNAEAHVDALAPHLAHWLEQVPTLFILCTSRVRMGHPSERIVTVEGLAPQDAVVLLGGNGTDFRELAAVLEYNPLALTVAAEPCQLLGPRAVLERLAARGDAFGLGQQSLDSAVETSWRLLRSSQKRLLTFASLVPGGLPLVVLERWAGPHTLSDVQGLLRHALVRTRQGRGGPRVEVPYPVRPFARGMSTSSDLTDLQEQVVWWAAEQEKRFNGPQGEDARALLREMAPCLLFAAQVPGPQQALCLASWSVAVEDVMLSQAVLGTLKAHRDETGPHHPELALRLGLIHWRLSQFDEAVRFANRGLSTTPEPELQLALLNVLANAYFDLGDEVAVVGVDAQAAALDLGRYERLAWNVHRGTRLLYASDPEAVCVLESAWTDCHEFGALRLAAYTASQLASAYNWRGDLEQALGLLDAALSLCKSTGDWSYRAVLLHRAADAAVDQGLVDDAEQFLVEAATTWRALGRPHPLDRLYLIEAKVAFLRGEPGCAIAILSKGMVGAVMNEGRVHAALVLRGMVRSYCGELLAGLRDLDEPDLHGRPVMALFRHTIRLLILLRLGEVDRAREERARAPEVEMELLAQYQALAHAGFDLYLDALDASPNPVLEAQDGPSSRAAGGRICISLPPRASRTNHLEPRSPDRYSRRGHLGDERARELIERSRDVQPPSMEFMVLWEHLDWLTERCAAGAG